MSKLRLAIVTKVNRRKLLANAEFVNDDYAMGQFKCYACSDEVVCVALVDSSTTKLVGFVAYILKDENLGAYVNAYVNVEFVFLHPRLRQNGNSYQFIRHVEKAVSLWILSVQEKFNGYRIILNSVSTPITDAGARFVKALDRRLSKIAKKYSLNFLSSSPE